MDNPYSKYCAIRNGVGVGGEREREGEGEREKERETTSKNDASYICGKREA